jgi:hypothetical protein
MVCTNLKFDWELAFKKKAGSGKENYFKKSPLVKGVPLHLYYFTYKKIPLSLKDDLCNIWSKLALWL